MGGSSVRRIMGWSIWMGTLGAGMVLGTAAHAQQIAQEVATHRPSSISRISVNFQNAPVRDVVKAIAEQAGLSPAYIETVIPGDARVTIQGKNLLVNDAFVAALRGTGLVARVQTTGNVIIVATNEQTTSQGSIVGKVLHAKTKEPVSGATILLGNETRGIQTGSDGTFKMTVATGEHTIHIRSLGMVRQARRVTVPEGGSLAIEVLLEPSASVLDEVIVTGTVIATERKAIATPITVITASEIERRGITRIEEFFRGEVPGVLALERGSESYSDRTPGEMVTSKVFSRGSSGLSTEGVVNPLKTYIDGVELLDPSYLGTIDPRSIERIEIVTGPQAATIYGSGAMGGVMQIFTKKGNGQSSPKMTLNLRYGMLESNISNGRTPAHRHGLNVVGGLGPSFSYSGNASYDYTGEWQPALYRRGYGASVGVSHVHERLTVSGSVSTTNSSNGTSLRGWIRDRARHESGEFWLANFPPGLHTTQRTSMSSSQILSLNADYRLTSAWQHSITIGKTQTDFSVVPEHPSYTTMQDTLYRESRSTGKRVSANYNNTVLWQAMRVMTSAMTFGVNGSWGDQMQVEGCTASAEATAWVGCSAGSGASVNRTIRDRHWGGFGSVRLGFFDRLYLNLGLRGERSPNYGENHKIDWTPTNGAAYTFEYGDLSVKVLGSYGRATRIPPAEARLQALSMHEPWWDPPQYASRLANQDLTPEYSRGPEGGIEIYYGNLGSLTINHYQQKVTDLIQEVIVDSLERIADDWARYFGQTQYRNVASVRQVGWEATGSLTWQAFTIRGTYSWNDSRVIASQWSGFAPGQTFLGLPTHTAHFIVGYARGNTSVNIATNMVGNSSRLLIYTPALYEASNLRLKMYPSRFLRGDNSAHASRLGYMKSDLSAQHRLNPSASITLHINNLANSFGSEAMPTMAVLGRQTLLGVSVQFPRR